MELQKRENRNRIIEKCIIYFSPVIGGLAFFAVQKVPVKILFAQLIVLLIVTCVFSLLLGMNKGFYRNKIRHPFWFFGCYFLSFFWLGLNGTAETGGLWFLLVAAAALDAGIELAVCVDIFLMTGYLVLHLQSQADSRFFLVYFVLGMVIAVLFSILRNWKEAVYAFLILLAIDLVLHIILYDFKPYELFSHGQAMGEEFISILALVSVGALYVRFLSPDMHMERVIVRKTIHLRRMEQEGQKKDQTEKNESSGQKILGAKELFDEEEHLPQETEILKQILQPDYPLLRQLRQFSPALYDHSQKISALAGGAARMIGGNELLARAGGMYHEIGRMADSLGNYIAAGERIGKEAGFPDSLLALIRQHSPVYELPKSVEAAVVMLSDSVISTGEYLIKNGQRGQVTDEHLIENIFQKRISKGNLSEAALSEEEIKKLKEYFVRYVSVIDKAKREG